MRAVIQDRYGTADVVRLGDLPRPEPAPGQVLVRVHAASLNGSDRENLTGSPFYARLGGLRRPRRPVPGSDIAGVVTAVGRDVTGFAPGDEVYGELAGYRGGLAEYVAARADLLARKPAGLSFTDAAAIPQAGCIAWRAVHETGKVRPGDKVLVNGAGGAGGAFVVGLAKHAGAEVTAVDRAGKADHLRRVGADHTVACETEDWAAHADHHERYDLIVDLVARRSPYRVHRALRPGGAYYVVGGLTRTLLATLTAGPAIQWLTGKRVRVLAVPQSRDDLVAVTRLVTTSAVVPAIDRVYAFDDVPEAYRRLASSANRGKIVVEIVAGPAG
ncbi:NAD(P)-dependent alcohol dehydrogenase [Myceligenerans pegani]|uniref:NAD(P)-dependent alcohol dehydrogenase n=1 Tax=Myceligenerans pegani TaxID=2776917 RepID=A0ABR9MVC2_9MICO|nr:NAD(P)-dependent alcohol dehydrogenase [Myceligenerans sp. TRM 65318]MBE1875338.1 NAD(P)-dependent alcohol dehydrogenase [Myceligenerans sp. TRM 65318]MBE3017609.1 NAD(P)-dependent alcohol dehydrogenase [Myceligenerans sp. TRM 65318]